MAATVSFGLLSKGERVFERLSRVRSEGLRIRLQVAPGYLSSEEVKRLISSEYEKMAKAAKAAGLVK